MSELERLIAAVKLWRSNSRNAASFDAGCNCTTCELVRTFDAFMALGIRGEAQVHIGAYPSGCDHKGCDVCASRRSAK